MRDDVGDDKGTQGTKNLRIVQAPRNLKLRRMVLSLSIRTKVKPRKPFRKCYWKHKPSTTSASAVALGSIDGYSARMPSKSLPVRSKRRIRNQKRKLQCQK
jgi:hypothetical protein